MNGFARTVHLQAPPRLPFIGSIDLTYRCNHVCRHCWLWQAERAAIVDAELTCDEICRIADQARQMGTREWRISGGEPMLREDFAEIFDYLTRKATTYSLNSNGTYITPAIAQLLKRKGVKMIALYGATAETYDRVTRNPGGFERAMAGFRYLQEAGAGFIVQLIPMQENWHEWEAMQALARELSPHQRVGAAWLFKSACGAPARNAEIERQRLAPRQVIELDWPIPREEVGQDAAPTSGCGVTLDGDDRLFAACIAGRREFHIDAYGTMSWCHFIKDPALRYDLRRGSFQEAWESFIPACADKVRGGEAWRSHCGSCEKRADCRWCAVYAYLETGRYDAPVPYLCAVADEARKFKDAWRTDHRRYFAIAGITVCVESDVSFAGIEFPPALASFAVAGPGTDNVTLRHHFDLPDLTGKELGEERYRKPPWAISQRRSGTWIYRGIAPDGNDRELHRVAEFSADHTHGTIYSLPRDLEHIREKGWHSLSLFPTDQIWLTPLLADRNAVLIHSGAAVVNGQGLVFVGHSSAGKSTTMELLKAAGARANGHTPLQVEILCDDRNVLRKWPPDVSRPSPLAPPPGWRVHGTWSHGTTPDVSPASAPLRAILFLEQAPVNELIPLTNRREIWRRLLATLIRATVSAAWWQKELDVLEQVVAEAPCYVMRFDKSGAIVDDLAQLCLT